VDTKYLKSGQELLEIELQMEGQAGQLNSH
jgi:hypothetical protein